MPGPNPALLHELKTLVAQDRATTALLIAHLGEVDARRLYAPQGYPSMFEYCVGELRFSEDIAYKRIQVARLARQFPGIHPMLADGRLHLSAVLTLSAYLTPENAEELLSAAANQTRAGIERLLAERFPQPDLPAMIAPLAPTTYACQLAPGRVNFSPAEHAESAPGTAAPPEAPSRLAPLAPQRYAVQFAVDQATHDDLLYAQALLGHAVPNGDVAEVFARALKTLIAKLEQQKSAKTERPRPCRPDSIAPGWPEDGVPVCVARGSQYGTAVSPDGAGGVIVAWEDHRAGGASHVYAQRVTSAGEAVWTPDGVLVCPGRAAQKVPAIAADGTGGALIVWQDGVGDARDLHLQHLSSAGTPVAGAGDCGTALVTAPGAQLNPAMVADGQGGAVLVWEDRREEAAGLHALRLDAQGQAVVGLPAQGAPISTAAGRQRWSVVVGDGSQGAIVVWSDSVGVRVQRVTVAGAMAWSAGGVLVHALDGQFAQPAVASDSSGGAIVAWEDPRNGTGDIYAQRVTGAGAVAWAEGGVPVCIAAGEQYSVSLTPDGTGGALATWVDDRVEAAAVYLASRVARIAAAVKLEAVEVGPGRATLTWRTSAADGRAFRFKRRLGEGEWEVLRELTPQAEGLLVGEDRAAPAGSQVQYGLAVALSDMEELQLAAVSVLIPLPKPLALRFARCEEEGRVVRVALTLETDDAARLELFDVAGRRVMSREVGTLGAGEHEVRLPLPGHARAGVYFLRLRQNRVTRTDRVTVECPPILRPRIMAGCPGPRRVLHAPEPVHRAADRRHRA